MNLEPMQPLEPRVYPAGQEVWVYQHEPALNGDSIVKCTLLRDWDSRGPEPMPLSKAHEIFLPLPQP